MLQVHMLRPLAKANTRSVLCDLPRVTGSALLLCFLSSLCFPLAAFAFLLEPSTFLLEASLLQATTSLQAIAPLPSKQQHFSMLHSDTGPPSGPPIPQRPSKDGDEDESSESEDEQPPCQMFQVQGTDRKVLGHFKIDAPLDLDTQKNVIYWDDLLSKYEDALYIKDKDDKYVDFVKDKVSNEP